MVDVAQLERLTTSDVLSLAVELQRGVIEREAMKLVVAADWADRHCPATVDPDLAARTTDGKVIPGADRARLFGGDGTPEVMEFAPAELGVAYEMGRWQANRLIADALDLRHRLPRLWARVLAGEVPAWKACKIAAATRHLSQDAAGRVDADVCEPVSRESWSRFCDILTGRIIAADPELAQALADRAARARYVRTGASTLHGMKSIHAQAPQGDVLRLKAQIDRLAKIMAALGDHDSPDERRSKAMMLLGDPDELLALIAASEGIDLPDLDTDEDPGQPHSAPGDGHHIPNTAKTYTPEDDYDVPPDPDHDPHPDAPPADAADAQPAPTDDHPDRNDHEDHGHGDDGQSASSGTDAADSARPNPSAEDQTREGDQGAAPGGSDHQTPTGPGQPTGHATSADDRGAAPSGPADGESSIAGRQARSSAEGQDETTPFSEAGRENSAHSSPSPHATTGGDAPDTTADDDPRESSAHSSPSAQSSTSGDTPHAAADGDQRENSAHTSPTGNSATRGDDPVRAPHDGQRESSALTDSPSVPNITGNTPNSTPDHDQRENSAHPGSIDDSTTNRDDPHSADDNDPRENSARRRWGHSPGTPALSPAVARAILKAIAASGLDPATLGPQIVLYHHYARETMTDGNGTVRLEGAGPMTLHQLRGHLSPFARITVKPVIDLDAHQMPVDAYETPARLREQLHLRSPGDTYPWSTYTGRHVQMDHTIPYLPPSTGGPPGQTWLGALTPLTTFSHRIKTHGGTQARQPRPGTIIWRTRHGLVVITDHTGTHNLGTDTFAQAIWHAANATNGETHQKIEDQHPPSDEHSGLPPARDPHRRNPSTRKQEALAYFTRISVPRDLSPEDKRRPVWKVFTAPPVRLTW